MMLNRCHRFLAGNFGDIPNPGRPKETPATGRNFGPKHVWWPGRLVTKEQQEIQDCGKVDEGMMIMVLDVLFPSVG